LAWGPVWAVALVVALPAALFVMAFCPAPKNLATSPKRYGRAGYCCPLCEVKA